MDRTRYQRIYDEVYHGSFQAHLEALIGLGVEPEEAARRATEEAERDAHRVASERAGASPATDG